MPYAGVETTNIEGDTALKQQLIVCQQMFKTWCFNFFAMSCKNLMRLEIILCPLIWQTQIGTRSYLPLLDICGCNPWGIFIIIFILFLILIVADHSLKQMSIYVKIAFFLTCTRTYCWERILLYYSWNLISLNRSFNPVIIPVSIKLTAMQHTTWS